MSSLEKIVAPLKNFKDEDGATDGRAFAYLASATLTSHKYMALKTCPETEQILAGLHYRMPVTRLGDLRNMSGKAERLANEGGSPYIVSEYLLSINRYPLIEIIEVDQESYVLKRSLNDGYEKMVIAVTACGTQLLAEDAAVVWPGSPH